MKSGGGKKANLTVFRRIECIVAGTGGTGYPLAGGSPGGPDLDGFIDALS